MTLRNPVVLPFLTCVLVTNRLKSTYYINKADFVACHNPSYIDKYDMVEDLKKGGSFLLNCSWDLDELNQRLPAKVKKILSRK